MTSTKNSPNILTSCISTANQIGLCPNQLNAYLLRYLKCLFGFKFDSLDRSRNYNCFKARPDQIGLVSLYNLHDMSSFDEIAKETHRTIDLINSTVWC